MKNLRVTFEFSLSLESLTLIPTTRAVSGDCYAHVWLHLTFRSQFKCPLPKKVFPDLAHDLLNSLCGPLTA